MDRLSEEIESIVESSDETDENESSESSDETKNINPPKICNSQVIVENDENFEEIVPSDSNVEDENDTEELVDDDIDDDIIKTEDEVKSSISELDNNFDLNEEVSTASFVDLFDALKNATTSVCVVEATESNIIASVSNATISNTMIFGSAATDVYYGFRGVVGTIDYTKMYLSHISFDTSIYGETGIYNNSVSISVDARNNVNEIIIMNEIHPTDLSQYFANFNCATIRCENNVRFGTKFDTSKVNAMSSMFFNCPSLRNIDLSRFDTRNVNSFYYMFASCSNLHSLDLVNFNTSCISMAQNMFQGCINPETINVSNTFITSSVTSPVYGADMFLNCYNLVGGAGTTYDPSRVDVTYARVDGGVGNEGYFTGVPECKIGSTNYPSLETAIIILMVRGIVLLKWIMKYQVCQEEQCMQISLHQMVDMLE